MFYSWRNCPLNTCLHFHCIEYYNQYRLWWYVVIVSLLINCRNKGLAGIIFQQTMCKGTTDIGSYDYERRFCVWGVIITYIRIICRMCWMHIELSILHLIHYVWQCIFHIRAQSFFHAKQIHFLQSRVIKYCEIYIKRILAIILHAIHGQCGNKSRIEEKCFLHWQGTKLMCAYVSISNHPFIH